MSNRPVAVTLAGLLALWSAAPGHAQNIQNGKTIAQVWCSNCHLAVPEAQQSVREPAPTFQSIANMNTTTAASLAAFLSTPHGQMPDLALHRQEIRDVSAYILSLRRSQ